jgi:sugar-specific transcriptional regulator TrmB
LITYFVRNIDIYIQISHTIVMKVEILTSLGFAEKEAKLYLVGLALGATTVQELARKSGLKRPTVYLHMDDLTKKGLFETANLNNKRYYRAIDPTALEQRVKENLAALQNKLPKLQALKADTLGKPQVKVFEREEAIKRIYAEIKNSHSLRVWSNVGDLYEAFHDSYMELAEAVKENSISVREIIADNKESRRYSRLVAKVSGPSYSARLAVIEGLENDTMVYGNKVAIFRLLDPNVFVVLIEDVSIASTMRVIFDMAWKTAKPYR